MNKYWFYLSAIGSLAILTTGCGDSKPAATTPAATASPTAVTSPAVSPVAAVPATTPTAPTATTPTPTVVGGTPMIAGKPVSVDITAGLIAPTNGDNWAKTVSKGRSDPFATLTLQPVEVAEKDEFGRIVKSQQGSIATNNPPAVKSGVTQPLPNIKVAASPTRTAKVSGNKKIASQGTTTANTGITRDGDVPISPIPRTGINRALPKITVAIKPTTSSKSPAIAKVGNSKIRPGSAVPKIAKVANNNVLRPVNVQSRTPGMTDIAARPERVAEKPLQAMALEISGVIEVEGRTQVIVKLPTESFSRYIEVGDRIAGQVLVKRVEDQQTLSPTIVLEEVGVEVARKIGDKSTANNPNPQSNPK
jgi:hypothetical protein